MLPVVVFFFVSSVRRPPVSLEPKERNDNVGDRPFKATKSGGASPADGAAAVLRFTFALSGRSPTL